MLKAVHNKIDQESKTEIYQLFHVWLEPLTPELNYEVYFDVIMML